MPTIFTESFETDGNGTRYVTSIPEFSDLGVSSGGDFFTRTDGSNIASFYEVSGQDGSFYFAAMDLDGEGDAATQTLEISGIDITDFENLNFSALLAEDDDGANQDYDLSDGVQIAFQIDGGGFQNLLAIRIDAAEADGTNGAPRQDTDFNGTGDGAEVTSIFASFDSAITGTGASLDIRVTFSFNAGDEDIAIDNIRIAGDAVSTTPLFDLQITEMWPGNDQNPDLTEDWFEITNNGTEAWIAADHGELYFDDVSASTADADLLSGISQIDPGETVVLVDGDTTVFESVWAPVIDLTNVQIGTYAGAGLGGGGDAVNVFLDPNSDGDLTDAVLLDTEAYPDTAANAGQSWDVDGAAFSGDLADQSGVATTAPNTAGESAVGSPGNGALVVPQVSDFTLDLLHFADQEASTGAIVDAPNLSAVLNALRAQDLGGDGVADNTLTLSSGDAFIPGVFFDASEAVFGSAGIADIQIQNELGVQAIAFGNHEFDFGTAALAGLIDGSAPGDFSALTGSILEGNDFQGALFPYLSTNLDFAADTNMAPLEVAGGAAPAAATVTSSAVVDVNGETVGIVGATTPTLASISSPETVGISPTWAGTTPTEAELDALAAEIQLEVDALLTANPDMDKVILLAHMQDLNIERALATRLSDVDIIVGGGSNTRLLDGDDRLRDGDSTQGTYPEFYTNAGGTTTALVNTDGSYKYVGRLVIDFDEDGNIIQNSYDQTVSGAYATDAQGVTDLGAEGLIDPEIQAIADAIEAQIIATESNVFGVSDVFLNGNRSGVYSDPADTGGVRTQETNLGNLTADANLAEAQETDAAVLVSIKNGGGIRASIGETIVPPGGTEAVRSPNQELTDSTGAVIKPEGGISQTDIQTTLAFNNGLVLMTLTKEELLGLIEHGVGAVPGVSGRFPQVAGLKFSYDDTAPEGDRIINAAIFDQNDEVVMEIARGGELAGDPAAEIRIVTLDFLSSPRFDDAGNFIGAGDGYPFPNTNEDPTVGEVGDPAVIARVNKVFLEQDGVQTGDATFADDGTEQDALAEYLFDNFNPDTGDDPFAEADTGRDEDLRIQNLSFAPDSIFDIDLPNITINEVDADQDGTDDAEFIELFGAAGASLDGLSIVLYNGSDDASYDAIDLDGFTLDGDGFFVIGSSSVANVDLVEFTSNGLQNGADAVALVVGDAADFPTDTPVASLDLTTLVDAIVYGTNDGDDSALLAGLGETVQYNDTTSGSISRLPDGGENIVTQDITPGETNVAPFEIPEPTLIETVAGSIALAGAEISDFDPATQRAFVTSGGGLQVVDASDLANLSVIATLSAEDLGFDSSDITSVSVSNGIVAVARPDPTGLIDGSTDDAFTGAGQVLFYSADTLGFLGVVQVGPLPDMLTWNDAGTHVVVANEGQSSGDENQPDAAENPNGSVSIIEFNAVNPTASTVTTLDFTDSSIDFASLEAIGVRVNPNAPSAAADLEPEYITIQGNTAYVALQENNAVAVIEDITAPTAFTIDDILPLGTKDHSIFANRLDASNRDDGINLDAYPVQGMYMPDGLASYTVGGVQYFFTANEGDGRDVDESRGADLVDGDLTNGEVDTTAFDAETLADLADDAVLGRLKFSNVDGDTDGDGLIEDLFSFGARSFTIFDEDGNVVFDSGSDFEQITALLAPEAFNGNGLASSFDSRSDDKGPEPESVVLGEIDGNTYAFIGLERVGGIMVYDVSDPANAGFVQYIRNEDANGDLIDIAPEGLRFISADDSPTGNALLAVSSEESNTLTFHELSEIPPVITMISDIQGDTDFTGIVDPTAGVDDISPFAGQEVTIEAIVTADFQTGASLGGFYVQEEDADADGDAGTSEGVFIFDGDVPLFDVSVGDLVQVTGTVTEFFGETQITATEIEVVSSGNTLPAATVVEFPTIGVMIDQDGDFVADLESVEGMLVTIPTELTVTEMFQLDRFGTLKVSSDGRLEQFTQNNAPDAAGFEQHLQDLAARTLTIDDGQDVQNPDPILIPDGNDGTLTATDSFRMGDTLTNITGVITYSEDFQSSSEEPEFRIHLPQADYSADNARPATPEDVTLGLTEDGVLKVASLNVLNYFTTIDDGSATTDTGQGPRGADDLTRFGGDAPAGTDPNAEFDRQTAKLVNAIVEMDADILGLVELENSATDAAISNLVDEVNAALGSPVYDYIATGVIGGDAIAQGLIYKTDSVTPTGDFQTLETFNGIDFTDPLGAGRPLNRPALAQTFTENTNGEMGTIAVNHLKSKGSLSGLAADDDQGDGQGNNNATRAAAADLLAQWLASDPTGQGAANTLIVGDLNAYAREDPITTLETAGFTDLATEFAGDGDTVYSYVFDGQIGTLDYAMANTSALSRVTDVTEWHINADEADAIDYNLDFGRPSDVFNDAIAARHSDHDPVIFGLDFRSVVQANPGGVAVGTNDGEILQGTADDNFLKGRGGEDRMIGGEGNDRYIVNSEGDVVFELAGEGYDRIETWVSLNLANEVEAVTVRGSGDVDIAGNDSANWIVGNAGNNTLSGGIGNDRLNGKAGEDIIIGGEGNDILEGGAGADTFVLGENNGLDTILDFEDGVDLIDITGLGLSFSDLMVSGSTTSVLHFAGGSVQINGLDVADLSAADFIEPIGAPSIPVVNGTEGDDNLTLLTGPAEIRGLGGDDLLRAFTGSVTLVGGEGDDRMFVYDTDTTMIENAGEGTDTVYTRVDITLGDNIEIGATKGAGDIDITGNASDNRLTGNNDANSLSGLGGVDVIDGRGGADVIDGGTGVDYLRGGNGADSFVFQQGDGVDEIFDFELGVDDIDFAGTGIQFGDLTISDAGSGAFVDYGAAVGADVIEVAGVTSAELTGDQFQFDPLS